MVALLRGLEGHGGGGGGGQPWQTDHGSGARGEDVHGGAAVRKGTTTKEKSHGGPTMTARIRFRTTMAEEHGPPPMAAMTEDAMMQRFFPWDRVCEYNTSRRKAMHERGGGKRLHIVPARLSCTKWTEHNHSRKITSA